MDTLKIIRSRIGVGHVAAAAVGLAVGILYAWVLNPVEWTDATPAHLRQDFRVDFLRAAVDSFAVNRDVDLALARYQSLGDAGPVALADLQADPGDLNPAALEGFAATMALYEPASEAAPTAPSAGATTSVSGLLLPVCGVTVVLGILLGGVVVLRRRRGGRVAGGLAADPFEAAASGAEAYDPPLARADLPAGLDRPPLATFRTSYALGDDLYDDSFSIESASGDFLGECGVGIGDLIGVGEPKKVSAFEVWLFDKNDIQTVTKVLMSRYAFQDEANRNRVAAKGDPILAEPGVVVTLETASLIIEARVVDLSYGGGALPAESFFERMTIELRASSKLGVD